CSSDLMRGAQQRLTSDEVIANATVIGRNSRSTTKCQRLAALITLHAADLPAAENLIDSATLVQELFAFADGQFVNVTDDEGVRDVLITKTLFVLQIERILNAAASGERHESRQCAVR